MLDVSSFNSNLLNIYSEETITNSYGYYRMTYSLKFVDVLQYEYTGSNDAIIYPGFDESFSYGWPTFDHAAQYVEYTIVAEYPALVGSVSKSVRLQIIYCELQDIQIPNVDS